MALLVYNKNLADLLGKETELCPMMRKNSPTGNTQEMSTPSGHSGPSL